MGIVCIRFASCAGSHFNSDALAASPNSIRLKVEATEQTNNTDDDAGDGDDDDDGDWEYDSVIDDWGTRPTR